MMCKILFKITFDAFYGRIIIPEFKIRKFLADQVHHIPDTHELHRFSDTHPAKVPVWVYVEIPPLDHLQVGFPDNLSKGFVFGFSICHAWKNKVVDGAPSTKLMQYFQAFHNVFKAVVIGPVIVFIPAFLQ